MVRSRAFFLFVVLLVARSTTTAFSTSSVGGRVAAGRAGRNVSPWTISSYSPASALTTTTQLNMARYKTLVKERTDEEIASLPSLPSALVAATTAIATSMPTIASAEETATKAVTASTGLDMQSFSKVGLTPETFQPVCGVSDGFYRTLQGTVSGLVGPEKFAEYGPLIAGGLLRVRLELCVVESFFNEAVGPFIRDNGVSWILPLHETVETFLAGAIFAVATTFILIGSTKLLTVIMTYFDFIFGLPARLLGGFAFDRAQGKPVTLDIGFGPFKTRIVGPAEPKEGEASANQFKWGQASAPEIVVLIVTGTVNYFGQTLKLMREILEAIDAFVGRYLVLWASAYLLLKFAHFKIFPDFP